MTWLLEAVGRAIARYLDAPAKGYHLLAPSDPAALRAIIRPADVFLVEGDSHIAGAIKYLTQSTWSHAALYVGPLATQEAGGEPHALIEANLEEGVVSAPVSKYVTKPSRICRPVGLSDEDCRRVCAYAVGRIGSGYDLKNIVDLARYLVPLPVPQKWRRKMIALGSGDPTKLICSGMIAAAFQSVRYPILPSVTLEKCGAGWREVMEIRNSSLFAPRDFDLSPYFSVIKPTIEHGFDYRLSVWSGAAPCADDRPDSEKPVV